MTEHNEPETEQVETGLRPLAGLDGLAWSADDETEPLRRSWADTARLAALTMLGAAMTGALIWAVTPLIWHPATVTTPATPAAEPKPSVAQTSTVPSVVTSTVAAAPPPPPVVAPPPTTTTRRPQVFTAAEDQKFLSDMQTHWPNWPLVLPPASSSAISPQDAVSEAHRRVNASER